MSKSHTIDDLKAVMVQLRNPDGGCPWDLSKDFKSIAPYTIEEAYEVVDAIDRDDMVDLQDELGDLLFQVIFHSQLADELTAFHFDDVVNGLTEKLIRRHPHVFGDEKLSSDLEIRQMWDRVKREEKQAKTKDQPSTPPTLLSRSMLADVPVAMPALSRAVKLQKKAASVGFDWPTIEPVLDKLDEELLEIREAMSEALAGGKSIHELSATEKAPIEEELGDLLFVMANFARHLRIDPEKAARRANEKFRSRFAHIEQHYEFDRNAMTRATLEEMDALWDDAKRLEKLVD